MNANVIYLQAAFWDKLRSDTSIAGLSCMINVYDAISEAELRTDISDETWDSDTYLTLLWKRHISGKSNIDLYECLDINTPINDEEDLYAIYMIDCSDSICDTSGASFGIKVINNNELLKNESPFSRTGVSLNKNTPYENRFGQFKDIMHHPCNAMILIDPYLLCKPYNIDNNLPYLLDVLLPTKKLKIQFQLSVYSRTDERGVKDNAQVVYEHFSNLIHALRKGLNYCLTLCVVNKSDDFHRRMIITNNILLEAPDGFAVFNDEGKSNKNARYDIVYPRLIGNCRQDMSEYLRWIQISKRNLFSSKNTTIGTKENRLFNIVPYCSK